MNLHILIVDDEELALKSIINELKIVFPFANICSETKADNAIIKAKELQKKGLEFVYAFLDIQMRGINGIELARQLKIIFPNIKVVFCTAYSEYAIDAWKIYAKGYLLKPIRANKIEETINEMIPDWRELNDTSYKDIRMQTFGNFEVFVKNKPINFEREKAKELLAYLVDRHGASVTTREIASVLWEDIPYDIKLKNRVTTIVTSLKKSLRLYGIEEILIKSWNHLSIDVSKIRCDAYDFEKGDISAINSFHGEYLSNYSWAEFTTGKYVKIINGL